MLGLQSKAGAQVELDIQHWSLEAAGSVGWPHGPAEEGAAPAVLGASDRAALCKLLPFVLQHPSRDGFDNE